MAVIPFVVEDVGGMGGFWVGFREAAPIVVGDFSGILVSLQGRLRKGYSVRC